MPIDNGYAIDISDSRNHTALLSSIVSMDT